MIGRFEDEHSCLRFLWLLLWEEDCVRHTKKKPCRRISARVLVYTEKFFLKRTHHPDTAGTRVGAEAAGNALLVVGGVLPAAIQS